MVDPQLLDPVIRTFVPKLIDPSRLSGIGTVLMAKIEGTSVNKQLKRNAYRLVATNGSNIVICLNTAGH